MDQLQSYDSDSESVSNAAPVMERNSTGPTSLAAEWEEFEKLIGTSGGPKKASGTSGSNEYGSGSKKIHCSAPDARSRTHSRSSESEKSDVSHQSEEENEDEDSEGGEEEAEEEGSDEESEEEADDEVAPVKSSATGKDIKVKDSKRSHRRSRSRSPRHRKSRSRSGSKRRHRSRSKDKDRRRSHSRSRDNRRKRSHSRHGHGSRRRSSSRHKHSRKRSHERKRSRSRSPSHGRDRGDRGFPHYRGGRGSGGRGRGGGRRDSEGREGSERQRLGGGPSSSSAGGKPLTFKEKMRQQLLEQQRNLIESQLGNAADGGDAALAAAAAAAASQPPIAKPTNIQALLAMGGGKATPQQALAQAMAAMHQKAQAMTGVKVPEYYNMAAVNPLKYAEQMKKRKMLWSKTKDNKEADKQWTSTVFQPESGGDNTTSKFRKLMGIKPGEGSDVPVDEKITEEQLRKQDELFRQLDRDYEFARMATHTHRGVGLGFQSQGLP